MIRAIIVAVSARPTLNNPSNRNFPNVPPHILENMVVEKTSPESAQGFQRVEDARTVMEELARNNPGILYSLFEFSEAMECPPGDIQRKKINDTGELVNA